MDTSLIAQSGSRLKLKSTPAADAWDNPAMARLALPNSTTQQRVIAIAKKVALWLCIPLTILFVICLLDLGKSETRKWSIAVDALDSLRKNPKDREALNKIHAIMPMLEESTTGQTPKSGLAAVWALGQIYIGNTEKGINACKWIESHFENTRFTQSVALTNFTETCDLCRGIVDPCPICKGQPTICTQCKGEGKLTFKKLDVPRLLMRERLETKRPIHRLGKTQPEPYSQDAPVQKICTNCRGTGRASCTECKGTGKTRTRCTKCYGQSCIVSTSRISNIYPLTIRQAYPYAKGKLVFEKSLDYAAHIQQLLHLQNTNSAVTSNCTALSTDPSSADFAGDITIQEDHYGEYFEKYKSKFTPPEIDQHIAIRLLEGKMFEGKLVSLSTSNLEIRLTDMSAKIGRASCRERV